jgi:hypothetical protein
MTISIPITSVNLEQQQIFDDQPTLTGFTQEVSNALQEPMTLDEMAELRLQIESSQDGDDGWHPSVVAAAFKNIFNRS